MCRESLHRLEVYPSLIVVGDSLGDVWMIVVFLQLASFVQGVPAPISIVLSRGLGRGSLAFDI